METLTENQFVPLPLGLDGWDLLSCSSGPAGEIILVYSHFEEAVPSTEPGSTEFWNCWRDRWKRIRVYWWDEDAWNHFELPTSRENYSEAAMLPDGQWLLVWRWSRSKPTEDNAHVYQPGTGVVRAFDLYPSFTNLEVSAGGVIWAGYDDITLLEGSADSRSPIPWDSGLVALDTYGRLCVDLDYLGSGPNARLPFFHCYALTLAGEEAWLYYFDPFSLLRLVDLQIRWRWETIPVRFLEAFAIATGDVIADTVLLGAIEPRHSVLHRLEFYEMCRTELHPVRESGAPIRYKRTFGRGNALYLQHAEGISRFEIDAD